MHDSLTALRDRSFRSLFAARSVSVLGNAIAPVALAFAVLGLPGGNATELGLVLFARSLAQVICLLIAGVVADRLPRYRVMVVADLTAGAAQLVVAVLFIAGNPHLGLIAALEVGNGAAAAFFLPASTGLMPQIVATEHLQSANALLRVSINSSSIVGSAIAGVLVATVGPGWALLADAVSFFLSAALLSGIRVSHTARAGRSSTIDDIRYGWREFTSRQWVWVIVLQFSVLNACYSGTFAVLGPIVAKRDLGGATAWAAVVVAMSTGLLAGTLVAMRIRPSRPMRAATFATFMFALPPLFLAGPTPLWSLLIVSFGAGICSDIFGVLWETGLQTHVPQQTLSRVSSYDALGSIALGPVGLAVVGPVADAIGVRQTLIGAGTLIVLCCAGALLSPQVRHLPASRG